MNADDRIVIAKCFLFSIKVLFAILYTITDRADKTLYEDYRDLADDLKRWYSPDASATDEADPDAASVKARWG